MVMMLSLVSISILMEKSMEQIQIATDDIHKEVSPMVEDHDSGSDRSESDHNDQNSDESDCESETADLNPGDDDADDQFRVFTRNGFMSRVDGSSAQYETILKSFGVGMGSAAGVTEVVAVHKFLVSGMAGGPRVRIFRRFSNAVGAKCGGNPNIRYAWYGGSRDDIARVVAHGFGSLNGDECGRIQLNAVKYALDGAKALEVGDDGLRHMLLCLVVLGKMEELPSCSAQVKASSNEFDSGVDCVVNPRRYFVWSNCMNYACPAFVVSFKGPASLEGYATTASTTTTQRGRVASASTMGNALNKRSARGGYISLGALVAALTRFLSPREMKIMVRLLEDFRAKKFDVEELKRKAKLIAGDKLFSAMKLVAVKGSGTVGGLQLVNGSVRDIYLPGLITVLAQFLPSTKIEMLSKSLGDFKDKKINRSQLANSVRVIVGNDNVLVAAINSYRIKKQRLQDKQSVV
ncbi:hypothetical protein ACLB2K_064828 [Fragaria x ananassa]